jgi:uncharacterized membrane protein YfcA
LDALSVLLPDGMSMLVALALVMASFFTSALTAAFGVGGGVAMLAILGAVMPVAALIPVHGVVQLGSNTGRAWHQRANILWPMLVPFLIGAVLGSAAGGMMVVELPDAALKIALGTFIIAATWTRIPGFDALSRAGLAIGGAVIGVVTMIFGATGPMISAFLGQSIRDNRKGLVATHALMMTVLHGLKVVVFGALGFAFAQWLPLVIAMIATGYAGTVFGSRLLDTMPEDQFRRWFRIGLTVLAIDMIRRGATSLV